MHYRKPILKDLNLEANCNDEEYEVCDVQTDENFSNDQLDKYSIDIVSYVAGFIMTKQIHRFLDCTDCLQYLVDATKDENIDLIETKKWGNLTVPPKDMVKICCIGESVIKHKYNPDKEINYDTMVSQALEIIDFANIFTLLDAHQYERNCEHHKYFLGKLVLELYFKISLLPEKSKQSCFTEKI